LAISQKFAQRLQAFALVENVFKIQGSTKETKMEFEGYCVKCREKKSIKGGSVTETKNGRKMAVGTCPKCGTKVTRFLPSK
jgi:NAD-dependent SIR2 family protein deacetylase